MGLFSKADELVLAQLDEPFKSRFMTMALWVAEQIDDPDIYMVIRDGFRANEIQMEHWKKGRVQLPNGTWEIHDESKVVTAAEPGMSPHNYRRACHILFLSRTTRKPIPNDHPLWNKIGEGVARFAGDKTTPGLKWGGTFKIRNKAGKLVPLKDKVHVEDWHFRVLRDKRNKVGLSSTERAPGELCPSQ